MILIIKFLNPVHPVNPVKRKLKLILSNHAIKTINKYAAKFL